MFLQLLANGLVTGSVIAIAAVGVSLVYEILRIVNFAHGDYLAFGTFVGVALVEPEIAWAKLAALAEGARLASAELW